MPSLCALPHSVLSHFKHFAAIGGGGLGGVGGGGGAGLPPLTTTSPQPAQIWAVCSQSQRQLPEQTF